MKMLGWMHRRADLSAWLDRNEKAWIRLLDKQIAMERELADLRKRVDALEARVGQYGDDHILSGPVSLGFPKGATYRNTQPYGANVDAMALHRECMEGIV